MGQARIKNEIPSPMPALARALLFLTATSFFGMTKPMGRHFGSGGVISLADGLEDGVELGVGLGFELIPRASDSRRGTR